jgi:hypothetical protein
MTHEAPNSAEADEGPEHTDSLPDATTIPVFDNPEDSFLPQLDGDLVD